VVFRSARGELDARIAATRAAIDRRTQCQRVRRWLAEEETRLRRLRRELDRRVVADACELQPARAAGVVAVVSWIRDTDGFASADALVPADAALAMRGVAAELTELAAQRRRVEAELGTLRGAEVHLAELLRRRDGWRARLGEARTADLTVLANERGAWGAVRRELAEALRLGSDARDAFETALTAADAADAREGAVWAEIALCIAAGDRQLALFARELGEAAARAAELGLGLPGELAAGAAGGGDRYADPGELLRAELAQLGAMIGLVEALDRQVAARLEALDGQRGALVATPS
jgi:hypothetical protein